MDRSQRVRDPIHNLIKFAAGDRCDDVLWRLIQQPELQRLRRIRQLGFSDLVYPGATHTRFSHVLGAMQMARSMIDVLERNRHFKRKADHPHWKTATLCAALLHDVGHGPFSHVFEEVSRVSGRKIRHEDWTRRIIEESGVAQILNGYDNELLEKTLSFFAEEPGARAYTNVVSSQLDADRLDFLLRDAYFTGVEYGSIDLAWLFDCLTIQELLLDRNSDAKSFAFVVSEKGKSVIENYIYAYITMYSKVYFHKTTRSAQFMLQDILKEVVTNKNTFDKLPSDSGVKKYFANEKNRMEDFLRLDDYSVWQLLEWLSEKHIGAASKIAQRLRARKLYKCFEPPKRPADEPSAIKIPEFERELSRQGIKYHADAIPSKGFKQYAGGELYLENILIYSRVDREPKPIGQLNPAIMAIAEKPPIRFYFSDDKERERARQLYNRIRSS